MKKFVINSCVSVGEIKLGMERDEARKLLGKFEEDYNDIADLFDVCKALYNDNDKLEFVEFHISGVDNFEIIFQDKILNKMSQDELISFFESMDQDLFIENYGSGIASIISNEFGIACSFKVDIEFDEDGNDTEVILLETISVAIKDYWK
jgi:hypothetical protein